MQKNDISRQSSRSSVHGDNRSSLGHIKLCERREIEQGRINVTLDLPSASGEFHDEDITLPRSRCLAARQAPYDAVDRR